MRKQLLIGVAADRNSRQRDVRGAHAIEYVRIIAAAAGHAVTHQDDVLVARIGLFDGIERHRHCRKDVGATVGRQRRQPILDGGRPQTEYTRHRQDPVLERIEGQNADLVARRQLLSRQQCRLFGHINLGRAFVVDVVGHRSGGIDDQQQRHAALIAMRTHTRAHR